MTELTFTSILPVLPVADVGRTRDLLTTALPFRIASGSASHAVLILGGSDTIGVRLRSQARDDETSPVEATITLGGTTGLEGLCASVERFTETDKTEDVRLEVEPVANVGWGKRQFKVVILPERHVLQFVQEKVIPQC